ncbi:MAG: acireductone synthase, partial [Acidimicrobiales bacterium]
EVAAAVAEISQLADVPNPTLEEAVSVLTDWMDSDDKARPLKVLQGRIWAEGFERGELIAQFFEDVIPALRAWRAAGIRLAVFSSGSVASQAAWFGHSPAGDLSGLFSGYFDTSNAGAKREPPAYRAIAESLAVEPSRITFFSDTPAELGAAAAAGLQAIGVARPGEPNELADFDGHRVVASFGDLELPRSAGT